MGIELLIAARRQAESMSVLPEHTIIMALVDEIERLREIKILNSDQYDVADKLTDLQNERDWALADVERLRLAAVKSVMPLEVIRISGWKDKFTPEVQRAIDEGIAAVRDALS